MNNSLIKRIDFTILIPAIILVCISLATLYSLDFGLFRQQLIYFLVSLFAFAFFVQVDYRIIGYFSKYLYVGVIVALLLLFVIGMEAKGAVRWIQVFGISVQFSEIFKPVFIIILSYFLTKNHSRSIFKYVVSLLLVVPVFVLIMEQPDLGSALIYLLSAGFMIIMFGFPILFYVGSIILGLIPMPFFYNTLEGYQKARLFSFLNPTADVTGASYNAIQALISIGSGGLFGKGFGQATQSVLKFLPERHTDFMFATIAESLGFIGGMVVIVLFAFLLYRIYRIGRITSDRFSYLVVMGFYGIFIVQAFFNIGMNIGMLPIVGITLPFVSYGGSSLLSSFVILGILSAIRADNHKNVSYEIQ